MTDAIIEFFNQYFSPEITIFLISMIPVIECRGAIPAGVLLLGSDSIFKVLVLSILGNMVPVPFILLFIRPIIRYLKKTKLFYKLADWIERKAEKNKAKVARYEAFGLFTFVAIPLPGTGAWTGSLVAAMLDMRIKSALPAVFFGVVVAAFIMTIISYGFEWIVNLF